MDYVKKLEIVYLKQNMRVDKTLVDDVEWYEISNYSIKDDMLVFATVDEHEMYHIPMAVVKKIKHYMGERR